MLNIFRVSSLLEGLSYLLILCVSLGLISREFVFPIGMTHGILFVVYILSSLMASHKQTWSVGVWLLVVLASVIPLAFIAVEFFVKKELGKNESQPEMGAPGLTQPSGTSR